MNVKSMRAIFLKFSVLTSMFILLSSALSADSPAPQPHGFRYSDYLTTLPVAQNDNNFYGSFVVQTADTNLFNQTTRQIRADIADEIGKLQIKDYAFGYLINPLTANDSKISYDYQTAWHVRSANALQRLGTNALLNATESAQLSGLIKDVYLDIETDLGNRKANIALDVLGALREKEDDIVAWQLRAYKIKDEAGGNAGLIYRRVDNNLLAGINVFFDYQTDKTKDFWRWSIGGETRSPWVDIFANYYTALTNPATSDNLIAYSADGYDVELNLHSPDISWLTGKITYYNWFGEFGDKNDNGIRFGAKFTPRQYPLILEIEYENENDNQLGGRLIYKHEFGTPSRTATGSSLGGFSAHNWLFAPVEREYTQRIRKIIDDDRPPAIIVMTSTLIIGGTGIQETPFQIPRSISENDIVATLSVSNINATSSVMFDLSGTSNEFELDSVNNTVIINYISSTPLVGGRTYSLTVNAQIDLQSGGNVLSITIFFIRLREASDFVVTSTLSGTGIQETPWQIPRSISNGSPVASLTVNGVNLADINFGVSGSRGEFEVSDDNVNYTGTPPLVAGITYALTLTTRVEDQSFTRTVFFIRPALNPSSFTVASDLSGDGMQSATPWQIPRSISNGSAVADLTVAGINATSVVFSIAGSGNEFTISGDNVNYAGTTPLVAGRIYTLTLTAQVDAQLGGDTFTTIVFFTRPALNPSSFTVNSTLTGDGIQATPWQILRSISNGSAVADLAVAGINATSVVFSMAGSGNEFTISGDNVNYTGTTPLVAGRIYTLILIAQVNAQLGGDTFTMTVFFIRPTLNSSTFTVNSTLSGTGTQATPWQILRSISNGSAVADLTVDGINATSVVFSMAGSGNEFTISGDNVNYAGTTPLVAGRIYTLTLIAQVDAQLGGDTLIMTVFFTRPVLTAADFVVNSDLSGDGMQSTTPWLIPRSLSNGNAVATMVVTVSEINATDVVFSIAGSGDEFAISGDNINYNVATLAVGRIYTLILIAQVNAQLGGDRLTMTVFFTRLLDSSDFMATPAALVTGDGKTQITRFIIPNAILTGSPIATLAINGINSAGVNFGILGSSSELGISGNEISYTASADKGLSYTVTLTASIPADGTTLTITVYFARVPVMGFLHATEADLSAGDGTQGTPWLNEYSIPTGGIRASVTVAFLTITLDSGEQEDITPYSFSISSGDDGRFRIKDNNLIYDGGVSSDGGVALTKSDRNKDYRVTLSANSGGITLALTVFFNSCGRVFTKSSGSFQSALGGLANFDVNFANWLLLADSGSEGVGEFSEIFHVGLNAEGLALSPGSNFEPNLDGTLTRWRDREGLFRQVPYFAIPSGPPFGTNPPTIPDGLGRNVKASDILTFLNGSGNLTRAMIAANYAGTPSYRIYEDGTDDGLGRKHLWFAEEKYSCSLNIGPDPVDTGDNDFYLDDNSVSTATAGDAGVDGINFYTVYDKWIK